MPNQNLEVSIIMPCLNEAVSLPHCLAKAFLFLREHQVSGEVIVVDNGSNDGSVAIAEHHGAITVHEPRKGYGSAITAGIRRANGDYLIIGDADDSYDFKELMPFVELMRNGFDLVVGNRFKGGIEKRAMPFLHRYLGNPILSFIGQLFFKVPIGDFHCGLRAMKKNSFSVLDLKTTGMEFASEMIVKAALNGLKIAETPVVLHPDRRNRPSHLNTWQDGWRHLRFLLLYSPKWLFLIPGCLLLFIGIVGTIALSFGSLVIGQKRLDVHTLVYTSGAILLGFQLISFYVFSRLYAAVHGLWPKQNDFLENYAKIFSLEKGVGIGGLLFLGGVYLMFKSFLYWTQTHFGNLDPVIVLRWVIPSVVLLVLGIQIITSVFYLSFLTIKYGDK